MTKRLLRDLSRRLPRWFLVLSIIGFLFYYTGAAMNRIVVSANGGKMPVADRVEDILFVIGNPKLGTTYFITSIQYREEMVRHQPMRPGMRYTLFADRIPMGKLTGLTGELSVPFAWFMELKDFPYDRESICSIGDLFLWGGSMILFIASIIFTWKFFHALLQRLLKKRTPSP